MSSEQQEEWGRRTLSGLFLSRCFYRSDRGLVDQIRS